MTYKIKLITDMDQEEEETVRELHATIFDDGSPQYDIPNAIWWIAYKDKKPAGFCGLGWGKTKGTAYLCRAGVLKRHRGHGLQKRFIRVREKMARKLRFKRMVSDTTSIYSANNMFSMGYRLFNPDIPWAVKGAMYFIKKPI